MLNGTYIGERNQILDEYIPLMISCAFHAQHEVDNSLVTYRVQKLDGPR